MTDTGSPVSILDEKTYKPIGSPGLHYKNMSRLLPYDGGKPLQVIGKCDLLVEKNSMFDSDTFYVVKGNYGSLLVMKQPGNLKSYM